MSSVSQAHGGPIMKERDNRERKCFFSASFLFPVISWSKCRGLEHVSSEFPGRLLVGSQSSQRDKTGRFSANSSQSNWERHLVVVNITDADAAHTKLPHQSPDARRSVLPSTASHHVRPLATLVRSSPAARGAQLTAASTQGKIFIFDLHVG